VSGDQTNKTESEEPGHRNECSTRTGARTLAYAADSREVPQSFVKGIVSTLGKPGWTYALDTRLRSYIVRASKHCVRIPMRKSATRTVRSRAASYQPSIHRVPIVTHRARKASPWHGVGGGSLCLERRTAAAGSRNVRIAEFEAGAMGAVDVVDLRAVQVLVAERVDEQLHAV
jgi:hypothetical protein